MLFAQKDQQSPAHGRVIVLHLRDDFHGHKELPVVYTNWRDCRLRGGLVSTARYHPQGARMEDTLLLSRNRFRAGYRAGRLTSHSFIGTVNFWPLDTDASSPRKNHSFLARS